MQCKKAGRMITTEEIGKYYYLFPQSVAMVSAGKNVMPAAWHTPISAKPPLYGVSVSPKRYTFELLMKAKGFTVNFLELAKADLVAGTGGCSGRDLEKVKKFGIDFKPGNKMPGIIISDAYAAYECEKFACQEFGDHYLFIGKILLIHYKNEIFEKGTSLDAGHLRPILYFGKDRYLTIDPKSITEIKR